MQVRIFQSKVVNGAVLVATTTNSGDSSPGAAVQVDIITLSAVTEGETSLMALAAAVG
jgi:hypothetical protein